MIILCSQWFAQLPTILMYMMLTVMHRTCNVLSASMETHHFRSNHSISWYLPSSKPCSQSSKPILDNAHTFLSLGVGHQGWWWWATRPPFPVKPSYFMIPTFIHALFTLPRAYFRQCAHISIVECRAQRMMVVGYNGSLFQDDGWITQRLGQY